MLNQDDLQLLMVLARRNVCATEASIEFSEVFQSAHQAFAEYLSTEEVRRYEDYSKQHIKELRDHLLSLNATLSKLQQMMQQLDSADAERILRDATR